MHSRRPIGVLIALAMLAAACTGSDGDATSSDEPAAVTTTEATADEVTAAGDASDDADTATAEGEAEGDTGGDGSEQTASDTYDGDPLESDDSDYLFDQERLHTFDIRISEEDLAFLDADPTAEEYVEGSLVFEGHEIGPIGIRYKGSVGAWVRCLSGRNVFEPSGEKTCTKLSMKLRINWDGADQEFFGQRRLQFHNQNLDPTHMRERLGYWLFNEMGVPAPRSTHARVLVNGEFVGLFGLTEQIDGRFTRRAFDDGTGNLYKEVWPTTAENRPSDRGQFIESLRTNEDDEQPDELLIETFATRMIEASGDPDAQGRLLAELGDDRELLAYAVVARAIRHDDGALHWYCRDGCSPHNFYWYEQPETGTVHLIPWDLDNAFRNIIADSGPVTPVADDWGEITNDCEPFPYGALGIEQRSAACDPVFDAIFAQEDLRLELMRELLEGPLAEETTDALLKTWIDQIESVVREADETHDDALVYGEWLAEIIELQSELDHARDLIRAHLAAAGA